MKRRMYLVLNALALADPWWWLVLGCAALIGVVAALAVWS